MILPNFTIGYEESKQISNPLPKGIIQWRSSSFLFPFRPGDIVPTISLTPCNPRRRHQEKYIPALALYFLFRGRENNKSLSNVKEKARSWRSSYLFFTLKPGNIAPKLSLAPYYSRTHHIEHYIRVLALHSLFPQQGTRNCHQRVWLQVLNTLRKTITGSYYKFLMQLYASLSSFVIRNEGNR